MRGFGRRLEIGRAAARHGAALALLAALALEPAPARAGDGGILGFLSSTFGSEGGGSAAQPAPPAAAASEGEQVRPLTVRRTPRKAAHATRARAQMARAPARTGPVSIYEDSTLRYGDAVMTKTGMKVFAGGRFSPDHPYGDADFIAVSASKNVGANLKKTVIELNKLPHG